MKTNFVVNAGLVLVSTLFAGCGPKSGTEGEATAQPVPLVFDFQKVAGKAPGEVELVLGPPTASEESKYGPKKIYRNGAVEIVFIKGKADWITINGLDEIPYSPDAIGSLGLERSPPSFTSDFVLRWGNIAGVKEASIFKGKDKCSYAYIKVSTK